MATKQTYTQYEQTTNVMWRDYGKGIVLYQHDGPNATDTPYHVYMFGTENWEWNKPRDTVGQFATLAEAERAALILSDY